MHELCGNEGKPVQTKTITIHHKYVKTYLNGYTNIMKEASEDLEQLNEEGVIIDLKTPEGVFISRGYYGRQNKGYGWVFTKDQSVHLDKRLLVKLLNDAKAYRQSYFEDHSTSAFRVFNGEGDGLGGLTIDLYNDYLLLTWYSEGIYTYKEDVLSALREVYDVKGIYEKKRFDTGGKYVADDDFVEGERAAFPMVIHENGLRFNVDLNDGPMTGIFLDQREVRQAIKKKYSAGNIVLNTFSYTGAFSIYASSGGATKTISIDVANRSQELTKAQFKVNEMNPDAHEIRVMDVFNYFDYAIKKELRFDTIIMDPPSFARTKKRVFSVQKDYVSLLEQAIQLTNKSGVIVASTNYSGFDMKKFKSFIDRAFKQAGEAYTILESYKQPKDFKIDPTFKASAYLKVVFIKKL